MILKTPNKHRFVLLGCLFGLVIVLSFLKPIQKASKYPDIPIIEQKTNLDFIQISLNEENYEKLKKKRDRALSVGVLETGDKDYVPAAIVFNGQKYKADIRLKGDWTDHLKGDKWSFRVKLKDDKTILGMRKFSIHHPKTRGYTNEWLYQKAIKRENLIGLRYEFLEGAIHIQKQNFSSTITKEVGIYAIEETFDKRTIESNKRKESVILKYSENLRWNAIKKNLEAGSPYGLRFDQFKIKADYPVAVFSEANVLRDTTMFSYFTLGKHLLLNAGKSIAISDAFDIEKLAMQNALLNLFGAFHGNDIINLRFYYNPITSKLEPIAFDGNSGGIMKKYDHFYIIKTTKMDSLYKEELILALDKVSKPEYLENLISIYNKEISNYRTLFQKEFFNNPGLYTTNIKNNQKIIKEELTRLRPNVMTNGNSHISFKKFSLPNIASWQKEKIKVEKKNEKGNESDIYNISRLSNTKACYIATPFNTVNREGVYKVSVKVKKGNSGDMFGIRLQAGTHFNKVDAVFNLEEGRLKGLKPNGGFKSGKATIESVGGGWFICSVNIRVNDSKLRIVMGPTNIENNISIWEDKTDKKTDVNIIPSSLILEEIL